MSFKWKCFGIFHKWEYIDYRHVYISGNGEEDAFTRFLLKCRKCGKLKTEEVDGRWKLDTKNSKYEEL